ncbi:ABC transporter substrate-binding protein [Mesorhizobium sp. ANAO-SY3R2]|uniref:ABC transporter substrate-binding protein n=1 Tax=Mesorhizobium sp. ANAO-SY3R2 TaxID=3166644 RepID=UPI00366CB693
MKLLECVKSAIVTGIVSVSLMGVASAESTLRAVIATDLKILDPIFTTDTMARNYGYMVYDTLFAFDEKFDIKPQMVDTHSVSADKLVYTFTLRDGLAFSDGQPVTTADVIASLRRWSEKDTLGIRLAGVTKEMVAVDDKTFTITLKEPFGLTLAALAKTGANVPFIMPARVAATPASEQITDYTASGPFVLKEDERKPGSLTVLVRNPHYLPRNEPPSGMAGGKKVNIDRLELVTVPDSQTAVNALLAGEIDFFENPSLDLLPLLEAEPDTIAVAPINIQGGQLFLRMNHKQPPFNDQKVRLALLKTISQPDYLKVAMPDPRFGKECGAIFMCNGPYAFPSETRATETNFEEARKLLAESSYDGSEVVILRPTTIPMLKDMPLVAKQAMERVGFKVRVEQMDWQTFISRRGNKGPAADGGWDVFMSGMPASDVTEPALLRAIDSSCDTAYFGWPCDEAMEKLRESYFDAENDEQRKSIAKAIQDRVFEYGTYGILGEYFVPAAWRSDAIKGLLQGPVIVWWNVSKVD